MGTEILKSFGTLQSELEQAKSSLKGVDENIKRLIGRDPSEVITRPVNKRIAVNELSRERQRGSIILNRNIKNINHENNEPPNKRRNISVFKRLSERPSHYEDEITQQPQKQLISKVIVTPKEVPSRQEALAAQSRDEKSKARNRRMFGALLGTLQKFQQEETKLKSKEEKRAQVEKKIEEHEIREKQEIKKERQELFFNRKKKQAEIKMIELKMTRMKEYALWEERQKPRMNFIQTKAKPHIQYLPRRLNDNTKTLLETCKVEIEKTIANKKQDVCDELQLIEDRMKKNFEPRKTKEDKDMNKKEEKADDEDAEVENKNESHEFDETELLNDLTSQKHVSVDFEETDLQKNDIEVNASDVPEPMDNSVNNIVTEYQNSEKLQDLDDTKEHLESDHGQQDVSVLGEQYTNSESV